MSIQVVTKTDIGRGLAIEANKLVADAIKSYASQSAFPATGESGAIYVDEATGYIYTWDGSAYQQVGGGAGSESYASQSSFPATGETGKLYIDSSTGKIYYWNGSSYVEASATPATTVSNSLTGTVLKTTVDGVDSTIDLASAIAAGETTTSLSGVLSSGNKIGTYTNEDATAVDIKETITSIASFSFNAGTSEITLSYTKEDGTADTKSVNLSTLKLDTIASITVSSDGLSLVITNTDGSTDTVLLSDVFDSINHTLSSTANVLTSVVGGTTQTANIVNSLALALVSGTTIRMTVNGVDSADFDLASIIQSVSVNGAGTPYRVVKWSASGDALDNSIMYDDGSHVGIGTTNPLEILHIQDVSPIIQYTKQGILNWYVGNIYGNDFTIKSDAEITPTFTISSPGLIGIGTITPTEKFHLVGNGIIEGKFKQGDASNVASGTASHAEGYNSTASGNYSHAEGQYTIASAQASHAEGSVTTASGVNSHAEGGITLAQANGSHAEGYETKALSDYSHAEGKGNETNGLYSHAEGEISYANGRSSHAEGLSTRANGDYSHAEGASTVASGNYSHAEGYQTTASGAFAHAEGYITVASSAYASTKGHQTLASADYSNAEGFSSQATGIGSHSEGDRAIASGVVAHAEGQQTTASGLGSHAEGINTIAAGGYSHAEGYNTIANADYQHVQGGYNLPTSDLYAFIHGNGSSSSNQSNLIEAYSNTIKFANNASVGAYLILNVKGLPTSATGLSSGDVWNNSGVLNIVP